MKKLLFTELKRAIGSPILWIGIIAVIALNVFGILMNTYGFEIYTTTFIYENAARICVVLAVLIPLHIGQDFETRTVNNKITAGYTRKEIYLAELSVSAICSMILFIADLASVLVCSEAAHLKFSDGITCSAFIIQIVIGLICALTISSLFTMIVMITHKQLISIGITVLLTLSLLTLDGNTVSKLGQAQYNIDTQTNERIENTLYVSGLQRAAASAHLLISPFAQTQYHATMLNASEDKEDYSLVLKDFPYHIEFCMVNLLELLLFYKAGLRIFRRQDLK